MSMMSTSYPREHLNYFFPFFFYWWGWGSWGLSKVQTTEFYNLYVYLILLAVSVFKL